MTHGLRALIASMACLVLLPALAGTPADRFEIVGIRTGMTEAEVVAALKAHNPSLQLQRTMGFYTYRDGVTTHRTPEYLRILQASPRDGVAQPERIYVLFSSLPGEQRVVSVSRLLDIGPQPPTAAQMEQQLQQKYGAPLYRSAQRSGVTLDLRMVWEEEGKPNCWRTTPKDVNVPATGPNQGPIADHVIKGQSLGRLPRVDLASCGKALGAEVIGDPVRTLRMSLSDLGPWAASDVAASRWVDGLQKEAERSRVNRGSTPKL